MTCNHIYDETDQCFECDHPKPKGNIMAKKFEDNFSDDLNKKIGEIYDILDDKSDDHSNNENRKSMIRLLLIMARCEGETKIIKLIEDSTYGGKK